MKESRIRVLNEGKSGTGPVVYWMSRDQRVHNNWALIFAQQLSAKTNSGLIVLFNLLPDFLEATIRQYRFMLSGLKDVEKDLSAYNIPFILLQSSPEENLTGLIKAHNISSIVTDFDPLKIKTSWKQKLA